MKDSLSGKRSLVVAAFNSPKEDKAVADWICDGIMDEVEVKRAKNLSRETGLGLYFCKGQYWFTEGADIT